MDRPNTLVREGGKNTLVSINYPNTLVHGGKHESVKTLRIPSMPTPGTPFLRSSHKWDCVVLDGMEISVWGECMSTTLRC